MIASFTALSDILKQYRRELRWILFFSFVSNLLMLTPTIYMMQIYDRILVSRNQLSLISVTIIMALFIFFMAFSEFLRSRLLVRVGVRFDNMLGSLIFKQSFQDYLKDPSLEPSKVMASLTNLRQFLTGNGILAILDAPWVPIYTLVGFLLHPAIGWLIVFCCIFQIYLAYQGHKALSGLSQEYSQSNANNNTFLFNKIRNADSVEAMGMRKSLTQSWLNIHNQLLKINTVLAEKQSKLQGLNKAVRQIMQSASLGLGALLVIKGGLSVGSMIAANVLVSRALAPLDVLLGSYKQLIQAKEAYFLLEAKLQASTTSMHKPAYFQVPQGKIQVRNLTLSVATSNKPMLKNINLDIEPGKCYVMIGHSGSGKSTLVRCMLGIWPNMPNQVSLDDVSLADWDRQQLGKYIGYLPQDIQLFEGTIADNIARFGQIDATAVIAAAKATGLHETILKLPSGYDTYLDEFSSLLSGGQKQRLGLARAVYGNPSLIFLDEPNANLDDQGELALLTCLKELKKQGKTIIVVAHRGGVINLADKIIQLKQGEIVFNDTPEALYKQNKNIA